MCCTPSHKLLGGKQSGFPQSQHHKQEQDAEQHSTTGALSELFHYHSNHKRLVSPYYLPTCSVYMSEAWAFTAGVLHEKENLRWVVLAAHLWAQPSVTSAALLRAAGSGAASTRPEGCRSTPRAHVRSQAVLGALCLFWDYTGMAKSLNAILSRWRRGVSLSGQRVLFPIVLKETVAGQMEAEHKLSSSHSYCSKTSIILTTNNKPF